MFLEVQNIHKMYENAPLLSGVSFSVAQGELVCLLGASGSGKTTLLRLIAGLEHAEAGRIRLAGRDLAGVPPHQRDVVLMFQEYALFPHRTVAENVAFGLRMRGEQSQAISTRVQEMLELVGLSGFAERDVIALSGGEQQRVALARSLAPDPRVLLLDEPLGALDRNLRERLLRDLPAILRRVGVTTITVTHDQEEAFALADRVILLHEGRVVQSGTPEEVYYAPVNAWVADFLGLDNLLAAEVQDVEHVVTSLGTLRVEETLPAPGSRGKVLIFPGGLRMREGPGGGDGNRVTGRVIQRIFHGGGHELTLAVAGVGGEGTTLCWRVEGRDAPQVGETVGLWIMPSALHWLPA